MHKPGCVAMVATSGSHGEIGLDPVGGRNGSNRALSVVRCGAVARGTLQHSGPTEIIAVMERAAYVRCPAGLVCLTAAGVIPGPLNLELAGAWIGPALRAGASGVLRSEVLWLEGASAIDTRMGSTWRPSLPDSIDDTALAAGLLRLRVHLARLDLPDGLARIVLTGRTGPASSLLAMTSAVPRVGTLRRELHRVLAADCWTREATASILDLVGAGPGLTPSGDDLICGLMLVLHAVGRSRLARRLWGALLPEIGRRTTPISTAHLGAAAVGMSNAPIHGIIDAVAGQSCDDLDGKLRAAIAIGHTSGWDTLAGIVLGLDALVDEGQSAIRRLEKCSTCEGVTRSTMSRI